MEICPQHNDVLLEPGTECESCIKERDENTRRAKKAAEKKKKAERKAADKVSMKE
jgi:hypothetical protein